MDRDVERVRSHFEKAGEREWERLVATVRDRVSLELHRRLLGEWIRGGDRVLEVGAGAGRFTIELGRLGAQVTVTDVSSVQLELNERHVTEVIEHPEHRHRTNRPSADRQRGGVRENLRFWSRGQLGGGEVYDDGQPCGWKEAR